MVVLAWVYVWGFDLLLFYILTGENCDVVSPPHPSFWKLFSHINSERRLMMEISAVWTPSLFCFCCVHLLPLATPLLRPVWDTFLLLTPHAPFKTGLFSSVNPSSKSMSILRQVWDFSSADPSSKTMPILRLVWDTFLLLTSHRRPCPF